MSFVNLPIILSSEADSDNDLFNEEEEEQEEQDADGEEVEEDSAQGNEGVEGSGSEPDGDATSDASTDILEQGGGTGNVTSENASGVTEESGPAVHHAENDEVEIFRVDRRTERNATVEDEFDESGDDFQTPRKRRRVKIDDDDEEEEKPKKSEPAVDLNETFDSESCPICFESWTNSGDHRLASLKCGHLFGFGCIDKWLTGPGKSCPQCNCAAKRKDIRVIYAKKLSMADTAEADRLRVELIKERNLRLQAESEAVSYRIQAQFMGDECARLKLKIEKLQERVTSGFVDQLMSGNSVAGAEGAGVGGSGVAGGCYVLQKLLRLTEGACRVMAPCNYMKLLCIAQASPNPLFRGFGIRKIHLVDHHMDRFLVLHSQTVRDLALHPDMTDGLLLSVSMDKTAKLVSLFTSQVVQTYSCPLPVWSCSWHRDNHHQFFVGLVNGNVLQFDTRKTNSSLNCLTTSSVTPVCSLQYAPRDSTSHSFRQGGLFVGQLDRLTFFEEFLSDSAPPESQASTVAGGFRSHPLPLDGSLVSLSFEARTRHLMATFRPSRTQASLPTVRHLVCQMESRSSSVEADAGSSSRMCSCNLVHALTGGRQMQRMVRSRLYRGPGERLLAASGDEEAGGTIIWDAAQGENLQLLKGPNSGGAVVDLAPFDIASSDSGGGHGLVTLTESAVQFYRWREST